MKMTPLSLFLLVAFTALTGPALLARTWTSSDGRKLEADLVKVEGSQVTLKRLPDGRIFTLALEKLSVEDREWIATEAAKKAPSTGTPKGASEGLGKGEMSVKGREILADGRPFSIQGVCYHPVPIGKKAGSGDLCADANADTWERDLPLLRGLGANTLRLYSWDPEVSHRKFLKAVAEGPRPLRLIVNKWIDPATDCSDSAAVEALVRTFEAIAKDVAREPAVLGIALGNEANVDGAGEKEAFWEAHEKIAAAVKKAAPHKLVTIPITDKLGQVQKADAMVPSIDVWAMQIYRGVKFGSLFDTFEKASKRPLVITEFGIDAFDAKAGAEGKNDAEFAPEAFSDLWKELARARSCAGGCWFEFCDEWWKHSGGDPAKQDTGGKPNAYPDGEGNEEWYGIYRLIEGGRDKPATLQPRALAMAMSRVWLP